LIAQGRALTDQLSSLPAETANHEVRFRIEVDTLTPGQVADLCFLHQQAHPDRTAYSPIDPHLLPMNVDRPAAESTRIDTRLHVLYKELEKIEKS